MAEEGSGRSFAEYLKDALLEPESSAKLVLTGKERRSADESKFVFSSPESGTFELNVAAVTEFEALDGG
ncbi:hypothetical protein AB0E69_07680 [Kribbella sp. NPDC026611]|uniref:hypothetical protein n=1 Tax=Kribbella sp. NPDC026611 TaxID=3154911 RepID=UPI0033F94056